MEFEIIKLDLTDEKIKVAIAPFADKAKARIVPIVKQCWENNIHFSPESRTAIFLTMMPEALMITNNLVQAGVDERIAPMAPSVIYKNLIEDCLRDLAKSMVPGELKRIQSESAN